MALASAHNPTLPDRAIILIGLIGANSPAVVRLGEQSARPSVAADMTPWILLASASLPFVNPNIDVQDVSIPSVDNTALTARTYIPKTGKNLPVLSLLPGGGAGIESVEWAAKALAERGYAVIVTKPQFAGRPSSYASACISGIDYMSANKALVQNRIDPSRVGIAGWSLGARALTLVQEQDSRVRALVAWDNLATSEAGDAGSPSPRQGLGKPTVRTPKVPALGLASDATGRETTPESKITAFEHWVSAKVPSATLVFRNSTHFWWSNRAASDTHLLSVEATDAWFRAYLKNDPSALQAIGDGTLANHPLNELLSLNYTSGFSAVGRSWRRSGK